MILMGKKKRLNSRMVEPAEPDETAEPAEPAELAEQAKPSER